MGRASCYTITSEKQTQCLAEAAQSKRGVEKNIKNIRWIQRYSNFEKALKNLTESVEIADERELSKLEKQGLIQLFEYTYKLARMTTRDFYHSKRRGRYPGQSRCV